MLASDVSIQFIRNTSRCAAPEPVVSDVFMSQRCPARVTFSFSFVTQLGEVMLSMASNLMLADERVLWMAQREAMACSRIIACLQKIAVYRLATVQVFSLVSSVNTPWARVRWAVQRAEKAVLRRFSVLPTLTEICRLDRARLEPTGATAHRHCTDKMKTKCSHPAVLHHPYY